MQYWAIFFVELLVLFFTSKFLVKSLSQMFYSFTHSKGITVRMLALIFFPGVVIHELSHFLMAEVLFVKAHEINLVPSIDGDNVRLGSVQISKTDIFRSMLIGLAPVLFGGALLGLLSWYTLNDISIQSVFSSWFSVAKYLAIIYGFFVIANTMFSSKKDVEGGVLLLGFIVFVLGSLQLAGVDILQTLAANMSRQFVVDTVSSLIGLLLIPVSINVFLTIVLGLAAKKRF